MEKNDIKISDNFAGKSTYGPGENFFSLKVNLRRLFISRPVGMVFSAIILLLVIGLVALLYKDYQLNHKLHDQLTISHIAPGALAIDVNRAVSKGHYQTAINMINKSGQKSESSQLLLESVYADEKNYGAALKIFQQLIQQYGMNFGWAVSAGQVAELAKNNTLAISYYQKAETQLPSSNSILASAYKSSLDQKIKDLQKS